MAVFNMRTFMHVLLFMVCISLIMLTTDGVLTNMSWLTRFRLHSRTCKDAASGITSSIHEVRVVSFKVLYSYWFCVIAFPSNRTLVQRFLLNSYVARYTVAFTLRHRQRIWWSGWQSQSHLYSGPQRFEGGASRGKTWFVCLSHLLIWFVSGTQSAASSNAAASRREQEYQGGE